MQTWEYDIRFESGQLGDSVERVIGIANAMGAQGWEMVNLDVFMEPAPAVMSVFKRPRST
jgi:hypothetical protein